eukprot:6628879-Pyramimonas_sp.AAC.1
MGRSSKGPAFEDRRSCHLFLGGRAAGGRRKVGGSKERPPPPAEARGRAAEGRREATEVKGAPPGYDNVFGFRIPEFAHLCAHGH